MIDGSSSFAGISGVNEAAKIGCKDGSIDLFGRSELVGADGSNVCLCISVQ